MAVNAHTRVSASHLVYGMEWDYDSGNVHHFKEDVKTQVQLSSLWFQDPSLKGTWKGMTRGM